MRREWLVFGAVLLLLPSAGCVAGNACPAIGWSNLLTVEVDGDWSAVDQVQVCAGEVCSVPDQIQSIGTDGFLTIPTTLPTTPPAPPEQRVPATAPTASDLPDPGMSPLATRADDRTWRITYWAGTPEDVQVRALSAAGEVLAEQHFDLEWRRVGGSERCGGPHEAGPLLLSVEQPAG